MRPLLQLLLLAFGSIAAGPVLAQSNLFLVNGTAGDFVTQGRVYVTTNAADIRLYGGPATLQVNALGYTVTFDGPGTSNLSPGVYTNALRIPFNDPFPGLTLESPSLGCDHSAGNFEILEIHVTPSGQVDHFWATFSFACCGGLCPAATGELRCASTLARPRTPRILRVPSEFLTIQSALDAANPIPGDTVLVAPGTYNESLHFKGKHVTLVSEQGPTATTIIGGQSSAAVLFDTGETADSVVSGFTLANSGVGVQVSQCAPTIISNIISQCNYGIGSYFGSPLIRGNQVSDCGNDAINLFGYAAPRIENNLLQRSLTGISLNFAGVPAIKNNIIRDNRGYGISLYNQCDAKIIQNLIINNSQDGVILQVPSGTPGPTILNNTVVSDLSSGPAGIFVAGFDDAKFKLINNAVMGNPALRVGGLNNDKADFIQSNDFFSPFGPPFSGTNLAGINGNISQDPQFACLPEHDFRPLPGSLCIDAGQNTPDLPAEDLAQNSRLLDGDTNGTIVVDLGAYEFNPFTNPTPCFFMICPPDITVRATPGQTSVVVDYPLPLTSTGATTVCSPASGSTFPGGTNIVTCTSVSGSNVESCTFNVVVLVPPPNDDFDLATLVPGLPFTDTLDVSFATPSSDDPSCISGSSPTVWYTFMATNDLVVSLDAPTDYAVALSAYTGSRGALTSLACGGQPLQFTLSAGQTCFIMAGSFGISGPIRTHRQLSGPKSIFQPPFGHPSKSD